MIISEQIEANETQSIQPLNHEVASKDLHEFLELASDQLNNAFTLMHQAAHELLEFEDPAELKIILSQSPTDPKNVRTYIFSTDTQHIGIHWKLGFVPDRAEFFLDAKISEVFNTPFALPTESKIIV